MTEREFGRIVHEIGPPAGDILRGSFAGDGRWVAALEFSRVEPGAGFQPTDVAFLRLLAPTIGRALSAAFIRKQAAATDEGVFPDAAGFLVLAPNGRVLLCTPAAEAWFDVLRGSFEPTAQVIGLPVPVLAAVARHRHGRDDTLNGRVHVSTPMGHLRVEASSGGEDGSIAIVLSAEPRMAMPAVPVWWPLTVQERATVTLAVHGLRNSQIAARMAVTENTALTHLSRAYDKLGITGRGQLLSRIFRDQYLPGLTLPQPRKDKHPFWLNIDRQNDGFRPKRGMYIYASVICTSSESRTDK